MKEFGKCAVVGSILFTRKYELSISHVIFSPTLFIYIQVMCWVAFDRALRLADRRSFPAPRVQWLKVRDEISSVIVAMHLLTFLLLAYIYEDIMKEGYNKEKGSFVMFYGSDLLDASLLIMPLVFFVSPTDPRYSTYIYLLLVYNSVFFKNVEHTESNYAESC